ncbi:glycosyltransferase family 4 protein [Chloroflexota bacterium]
MNILFINEYDWFKGVVFDIHVFSEGLSLLGHQVYAIDSEWASSRARLKTIEKKDVARVYPGAGICLRRPGFINLPGLGLLSTAFTHYREIGKAIKDWNIDVIVLYSVLTNGLQSIHLAKKHKIPVVFRNIDMLHNLMPNVMVRNTMKFLEKRVYSRVDAALALTPKYSEYLINMGANESKTKLLPFPADTELFRPTVDSSEIRQKWGLSEKDQIILFLGTLFKFSGLGDFIRELPEVIRQVPEARLLIVGDGPLRPELERITTELGLEQHIIITGFQPYQTLPQYMSAEAICINPFPINNATRDLFSAKIIQYLACGKATISTSLPGITTLLPGESHGVVYVDSAADMAREVVNLLKSTERRQQLGQAGLDYVRRAHNRDKITGQLETILKEVIQEKRGTAGFKHGEGNDFLGSL